MRSSPVLLSVIAVFLGAAACSPSTDPAPRDAARKRASSAVRAADPYADGEPPALRVWRGYGREGEYEVFSYDSLKEMTARSPEIVYASVEAIEPGRIFDDGEDPEDTLRAVTFVLAVKEVLASGDLKEGDLVPLDFGTAYLAEDIQAKYGDAIGDEGLFFVIRSGVPQPEFGYEGDPEELALGLYGLVTSQGLFINNQGRVLVSYPYPRFPADLDGTSFANLIDRVRALTS